MIGKPSIEESGLSQKDFVIAPEKEIITGTINGVIPVGFHRETSRSGIPTDTEIKRLIEAVEVSSSGNGEVVFTPEYSLFTEPTLADPIVLSPNGQLLSGQESVLVAIEKVINLAKDKGKFIVLSSVCEKLALSTGREISVNTALVISPDGRIIPRRKIFPDGYDKCLTSGEWRDAIGTNLSPEERLELDTISRESLSAGALEYDYSGKNHKAVTIICYEAEDKQLLTEIPDDVDILLFPMSGLNGGIYLGTESGKKYAVGSLKLLWWGLKETIRNKDITIVSSDERTGNTLAVTFDIQGNVAMSRFSSSPLLPTG